MREQELLNDIKTLEAGMNQTINRILELKHKVLEGRGVNISINKHGGFIYITSTKYNCDGSVYPIYDVDEALETAKCAAS